MKSMALALGTLATVIAPAVLAQEYYDERGDVRMPQYERQEWDTSRYYRDNSRDFRYRDDRWNDSRRDYREGQYECWNPRARHFEGVREGERQDDLDFSRCRGVRNYGRR